MSSSVSAAESARPRGHAARWWLAIFASVVVAGGLIAARRGELPPVALLPADHAWIRLDREITAEFGMDHPLVWILEGRGGTVWTRPVLERVQALTRDVLTVPGVIATDVVSLASPNLRDLRVTEDRLEPIYLMRDVPASDDAMAALRHRVESDPAYRGTLVSLDGRAAMIVANFRPEADVDVVGRAALALRNRYDDAETASYATGEAVLDVLAPETRRAAVVPGSAAIAGAALVAALVLGGRATAAAGLAAVLATLWTAAALLAARMAILPWSAYPLPAVAAVAAALALSGTGFRIALAAAAGCAGLAFVADLPVSALALGTAVGLAAAAGGGLVAHRLLAPGPTASTPYLRTVSFALTALALTGVPYPHPGFGLAGYGERYLPGPAAADLRGVFRLFPPPTALALRARGKPGFVAEPAVLHALDAVAAAVRADPAVASAMSIADIVKMVHRAFNDDEATAAIVPDDRGLVARYLTLAYSPGFRHFVDRGLSRTALWVYLQSDRPVDVARVLARLMTQIAAEPVPDAEVDLVGGDGAGILLAARLARAVAAGAAVLVVLVALVAGALVGRDGLRAALLGAGVAAIVGAGGCGWLGLSWDLVSAPGLDVAVVATAVVAALGAAGHAAPCRRLALALGLGAGVLLLTPLGVVRLAGVLLLAVAVGVAAGAPPDALRRCPTTAG
jgi:hypothetical protein